MTVPALDLGGTKFAAAAVSADGELPARAELLLEPAVPAERTLLDVIEAITRVVPAECLEAVGVGSAGPLDPAAGTVSPVDIPSWRDFPLVKTVGETLSERAVRLAGDARCMALGEWWRGGSGTARAMLGLVVSTGVGGGIVLDVLPYTGPTGNAGHIGHIGHLAADPGGPPCPCGATGCVEIHADGPNMAAWARDQGWDGRDAKHLTADVVAGNVIATRAFERATRALANGILRSAVLLDLDHVVIGGGRGRRRADSVRPAQAGGGGVRGFGFLRRLRVGAHAPGPRRRTARGRRSRPEPAKEHTMKPAALTARPGTGRPTPGPSRPRVNTPPTAPAACLEVMGSFDTVVRAGLAVRSFLPTNQARCDPRW
ncbi:ROK family protein [Nonomuraea sp. NPDC049655]|uniref:ROK family protein n=1 Tax=Nonomuraea sp. NPDC049655 TaxID=3364355 RepID=UPI0037872EAC